MLWISGPKEKTVNSILSDCKDHKAAAAAAAAAAAVKSLKEILSNLTTQGKTKINIIK